MSQKRTKEKNEIKFQNLKGFRDLLPNEMQRRHYAMGKLKAGFELYGFEPLETPALEYASLLLGKYGKEADKLIYQFKDRGGREVALRYDQTVPLIRIVQQYQNEISKPFKRYQIQPVWRAENPQKGRFREFLQCDIDIVGTSSLLADAEVIACVLQITKNLGFKKAQMFINDRYFFRHLSPPFVAAIDKLPKIGHQKVVKELIAKGMAKNQATKIIDEFKEHRPTPQLQTLFQYLAFFGLKQDEDFIFEPTLARGLDYYTGSIFELVSADYPAGSLGGGGRYDRLLGLPAVGFAFGFDRLLEAMKQLKLFPPTVMEPVSRVLVTVFTPDLIAESIKITQQLRAVNIKTELYPEPEKKLDHQLKYADRKGIPYVIIIGPEEVKNHQVTLKALKTKKQERVKTEELIEKLKN